MAVIKSFEQTCRVGKQLYRLPTICPIKAVGKKALPTLHGLMAVKLRLLTQPDLVGGASHPIYENPADQSIKGRGTPPTNPTNPTKLDN